MPIPIGEIHHQESIRIIFHFFFEDLLKNNPSRLPMVEKSHGFV